MPATLPERQVAIGRVRISDRGGRDPLRLALDVDRLLGATEIRPGRLPPSAILVVRSLADPLPRCLDPRAATAAAEWQRAAAAALDDCVARAARPAAGPVAADTGAVVFADRAELLAAAALDWCRGSLSACWWWLALGLASPSAVLRAFFETPAAVPAAVERLARAGAAAAFAARVPPVEAAALARVVAAACGVAHAAEAALARAHDGGGQTADTAPAVGVRRAGSRELLAPSPAPWHGLAPELAGGPALAVEQETLAGLAIALRRDAVAVRAPAFSAAARAWRAPRAAGGATASATAGVVAGSSPPAGSPPARRTAARSGADPQRRPTARAQPPSRAPAPSPSTLPLARALAADAGAPAGERARRTPQDVTPISPPMPAIAARPAQPVVARGRAHIDRTADMVQAPAADRIAGACEHAGEPLAELVHTRLGGLLHLVLAGQMLGFYGDFTSPARPGIRLDVWDFVTLVGRGLLGRPPRDPLWALLARLAGRRSGEPPGRGFHPPRTWRVPRSRLGPFADRGTWRCAERDNRLLLVHPDGFAVLDAAGADREAELRRYRVTSVHPDAWPDGDLAPLDRWARHAAGHDRAPLDRWVGYATDYVRARLAVALRVAPHRAARLALRRPARVLVTDTRIDVVSALADLPIEVRLAGLDRDPGFVPAAGRALRFHFE